MPDPDNDAPPSPASRRPLGGEEVDSIREEQQRPDHEDRHHGPHQEVAEAPVQVPEYQLDSQPIVNGRQPSRPGQQGRWEAKPGDRDEPGRAREGERRPQGQHEKA